MQRFTSALRLRATLRPSSLPRTTPSITRLTRNSSTSAPKSAEGPSAESGGSRSKSAAESQPSSSSPSSSNPGALPDSLSDTDMRGRTGGGKPLDASHHAPAQPKVWNHAVSGKKPGEGLTEEQRREVEEHNRDFEKKHDRANPAENDKVNKAFWGGRDGGSKE
ncbi:hypothetical protein BR93DRAFT_981356 [Coniochaeta sp. PMI_546]|nr:hypothetical protein BR93DRAFT_981356 [Coniochaeta sp. PMI_546]